MRLLPRAAAAVLLVVLLAGYVSLWSGTLREPVAPEIAAVNPAFVASDFFMPWYGARGLLAGKNPYDEAFHEDLHRAYYGAPLQRSAHLTDVAGFYYPPYVVVSLLPLVWLPFWLVRWLVAGLLVLALCASGALWTHLLSTAAGTGARARTGAGARWRVWAGGLFALLFHASISILFLQQHSGFVVLAVVAAHVTAARRRFAWTGVLLALAMVKPQLALGPAAGLLFWALWRRERWSLPAAFAVSMAAQFVLSELLLPGWIGHFVRAADRRLGTNSVHDYWLPGVLSGGSAAGGAVIAALLLLPLIWLWWRCRALPAASPAVLHVASLGFAVYLAVTVDAGLYNRALLVVPILSLASAGAGTGPVRRATARLAALVVAGPVAVLGVAGALVWLPGLVAPVLSLFALPLQAVDATHGVLPVLLLPALAALCFEEQRDATIAARPGVKAFRPAAGLLPHGARQ